jgi:hypothetical protein
MDVGAVFGAGVAVFTVIMTGVIVRSMVVFGMIMTRVIVRSMVVFGMIMTGVIMAAVVMRRRTNRAAIRTQSVPQRRV